MHILVRQRRLAVSEQQPRDPADVCPGTTAGGMSAGYFSAGPRDLEREDGHDVLQGKDSKGVLMEMTGSFYRSATHA